MEQAGGREVRAPVTGAIAAAYSESATAWGRGPGAIYDRLAEAVVDLSPVPLGGRVVLDVGAGTGAASRALRRAGASAVAMDIAVGMLGAVRHHARAAAVGDACALPFAARSLGGVVATFSLNHLDHPADALVEARRVTAAGGAVLASSYAEDDDHPVKHAVDAALATAGWRRPGWYEHVRVAMGALATTEGCASAAARAGLEATVHALHVPFPDLDAPALVEWRLGMAHAAPFVATLAPGERAALVADALARLGGGWPALERSVLVIAASAP